MKELTPSEAIQKLKHFVARIERLKTDTYAIPRLKTADLNKLRSERKTVRLLMSVAIHCKNKSSYSDIKESVESALLSAYDFDLS